MKPRIHSKSLFAAIQFLSLVLMAAAWIGSRTWRATDSHIRSKIERGGPEAVQAYKGHRGHRDRKIQNVRAWGFSCGGLIFLFSSIGAFCASRTNEIPKIFPCPNPSISAHQCGQWLFSPSKSVPIRAHPWFLIGKGLPIYVSAHPWFLFPCNNPSISAHQCDQWLFSPSKSVPIRAHPWFLIGRLSARDCRSTSVVRSIPKETTDPADLH